MNQLKVKDIYLMEEKNKKHFLGGADIGKCKLKEKMGCFPTSAGIVFECPDIDTCSESDK